MPPCVGITIVAMTRDDRATIRLRRRLASTLIAAAVCISATYIAVPFLVTTSSGQGRGTVISGDGAVRVGTASTLAADRPDLLFVFAIPALLALVAWLGLRRLAQPRWRVAAVGSAAFALVLLTVVFLSSGYLALILGVALLPVALLVATAAALPWTA
jgi:hypothetical protein